jgi:hypothetical protein
MLFREKKTATYFGNHMKRVNSFESRILPREAVRTKVILK